MTQDEKVTRMAEISMLASKIGNLIMADPLNMPDCAFACGIALNGILQSHKDRDIELPENAQVDLIMSFVKAMSATTAVLVKHK